LAEAAFTVFQLDFFDVETKTPDDEVLAARAVRVLTHVAGDIPNVNIIEAFFPGHIPGFLQSRHRSGREVLDEIHGVKTGEVEGNIGSNLLPDPPTHGPNLFHVVVELGNDQVDKLQPDLALADDLDRLEDGLELSPDIGLIEFLRVSLEVNLNSFHDFGQVEEGLRADVPTGDDTVFNFMTTGLDGCVVHVLKENDGFCVGIRNGWTIELEGGVDDSGGG